MKLLLVLLAPSSCPAYEGDQTSTIVKHTITKWKWKLVCQPLQKSPISSNQSTMLSMS